MFKNAPPGWTIKSVNHIYSNDLIKLFEDTLDLDGEEKIYTRAIRRNYSTIVPFISNNEILIIKSYRHLVDSIQVEAPSGYIEDGETPCQAAKRELEEETGYTAKKLVALGYYTLDYTMFEQKGNLFVAYDLSNYGKKQSLGKMEKIETDIITINEIKQLLLEGQILNAASIVAFYKALDFHKRYML